ncbi:MAG: hypothetical protein PHV54_04450 [Tolumonas sp.]|nr:hypothetical protein [Tolumonas sp.]
MLLLDNKNPDFSVWRDAILLQKGGLLSPGHCRYFQAYYEHEFEDCSFALVREDSYLLLLITRHWNQGVPCYSWYGRPIQVIDQLAHHDRAQSEGLASKRIRQLLSSGGELDYICLSSELNWLAQLLLGMGCAPKPVIEQRILLESNDRLMAGLRKAHRQSVRWGEQHLVCRVLDANNVTDKDFAAFESFHITVAGRRTRNSDSWLAQLDLVHRREGFLIVTEYEERAVGISLFSASGQQSCYSVGVYDRELFSLPISHYPLWLGLLYARELGCRVMDMGESFYAQIMDSTGRIPSEKECHISYFKRGFGGELIMGFRFQLQLS